MRAGTKGLTFVEVLVTISLLLMFVSLAYPLLLSVSKGYAAHHAANDNLEARLAVTTRLAALTAEVAVPYWENPDTVFTRQGSTWTVRYWRGDPDKTLVLSQEAPGRLKLTAGDGVLVLDRIPALSIDWWKKDSRVLGWQVQWPGETTVFHAAWGGFPW